MPLYESAALIHEKQTLVLEIGSDTIKWGVGGECAPRCVLRAGGAGGALAGHSEGGVARRVAALLCGAGGAGAGVLGVRERRVLVVVGVWERDAVVAGVCRALLQLLDASAVTLVPAPLAVATALLPRAHSAVVVDVGASACSATCVLLGHALPHASVALPASTGTRAQQRRLAAALAPHNPHNPHLQLRDETGQEGQEAAHAAAEALWARVCVVVARGEAREVRAVRARVGGAAVLVPGAARALPAELMFERDRERASLPDAVLQALLLCGVEGRARCAAGGVALCGGGAALPGLRARLLHELRLLQQAPEYAALARLPLRLLPAPAHPASRAPAHPALLAWAGGSLAAGAGAHQAPSSAAATLTRAQLLPPAQRPPDWNVLRPRA